MDCQEINTKGADRREKNLAERWEGLMVRAEERKEGKNPSKWKQRKKKTVKSETKPEDTFKQDTKGEDTVKRDTKGEDTVKQDTKGEDTGTDSLLVSVTQFVESNSDCG